MELSLSSFFLDAYEKYYINHQEYMHSIFNLTKIIVINSFTCDVIGPNWGEICIQKLD